MKLRVWWIPQVPMSPFYVEVESLAEGVKMMNVLADYDRFQYEKKVKPDYSNVGGIQMFDEAGTETEDNQPGWVDWYDEGTGIEDPEEFLMLSRESAEN